MKADVKVDFEQVITGNGFSFTRLPPPAQNDAGAKMIWKLVEGTADPNGAPLAALHDGQVPAGDDIPGANFFFSTGSNGGKILADLKGSVFIKRISSYSWHKGGRGPQVFTAYGTNKDAENGKFSGWKKIADVDTRPKNGGDPSGRHGVSITDSEGNLGKFRYLLFDVKPSAENDRFGLTFFSEIDIVSENDTELVFVRQGKPAKLVRFGTKTGKYTFQIDASEAPDLLKWSETELAPVIIEWYPTIVDLMSETGYTPLAKVSLRYRNDMPKNIPASASLFRINLNAPWFRNQLAGEAKGSVVHELVHIVQGYGRIRRNNPEAAKKTPSWVVEGLADYVRWFLYEPETGGAKLSKAQLARAKHDASYRTSANFIDWVSRTHDKDLPWKLNSAARKGQYSDSLWEKFTGKTVDQLANEWRSGD